jgi:hypothetical protein
MSLHQLSLTFHSFLGCDIWFAAFHAFPFGVVMDGIVLLKGMTLRQFWRVDYATVVVPPPSIFYNLHLLIFLQEILNVFAICLVSHQPGTSADVDRV